MEDRKNADAAQDNGIIQNPASHSDALVTDSKQLQIENNYDSHSEEKPHQKTTVSKDAKPDRVSHDTRDTTSKKTVEQDREDDERETAATDNEAAPFPKSNSSSFPSIS
jgi:hypothetical protein